MFLDLYSWVYISCQRLAPLWDSPLTSTWQAPSLKPRASSQGGSHTNVKKISMKLIVSRRTITELRDEKGKKSSDSLCRTRGQQMTKLRHEKPKKSSDSLCRTRGPDKKICPWPPKSSGRP